MAVEDGMGYMEPPRLYQPVRHCLGRVLLSAGRLTEAEQVRDVLCRCRAGAVRQCTAARCCERRVWHGQQVSNMPACQQRVFHILTSRQKGAHA